MFKANGIFVATAARIRYTPQQVDPALVQIGLQPENAS